ncbi:biotin/lipoyl-containing protein [Streptomyces fuscichromogenes]|uniref:biotin/lipoyl-containing protein n=1 Tax=Streptomyces fuscichromogenes TaxID=1324013 RepID=UPI0038260D6E
MFRTARSRVSRVIGESCLVATLALSPGVASPIAEALTPTPSETRSQTPEPTPPSPTPENRQNTNVVMPSLGGSVTEATVVGWQVKVGETVSEGDSLGSVETDKVDMEISAPVSGVVREILVGEGDTAKVGDILAVIGPPDSPPEISGRTAQ